MLGETFVKRPDDSLDFVVSEERSANIDPDHFFDGPPRCCENETGSDKRLRTFLAATIMLRAVLRGAALGALLLYS